MQIWVPIHVNHCNENWFQPARSDFAVFLSLFLYFSVWVICRHASSFPGISGWREQIAGVLGVGAGTERGKADGRPAGLGGLLMALASSTSLFGLILCRGSTWWRGACWGWSQAVAAWHAALASCGLSDRRCPQFLATWAFPTCPLTFSPHHGEPLDIPKPFHQKSLVNCLTDKERLLLWWTY